MRRIWFLLAFLGMTTMGMAQRLGYVDTQAILNAIPEYKQAQAEIERLSKRWEGEVASLFEDASALQAQLDAESVLLTPDMIAERKAAIQTTRDTARSRQMRYFSPRRPGASPRSRRHQGGGPQKEIGFCLRQRLVCQCGVRQRVQ